MELDFKYKAEIIVKTTGINEATIDFLYECDPILNVECDKKMCGDCRHTKKMKYAKRFDIYD